MCMGPNVRFIPTRISQKCHDPSFSLSLYPKTFGHQKYIPPKNPSSAPPKIT